MTGNEMQKWKRWNLKPRLPEIWLLFICEISCSRLLTTVQMLWLLSGCDWCTNTFRFLTWSLLLWPDPPDFNPNGTSHEKPHQLKSRRGRPRYNNDRNLSGNSYDPSQQLGHLQQCFDPPSSSNNSNHEERQHPPYEREEGARRRGRGRGRRDGNRDVNVSSGWQRPGGDYSSHGGSNRGAGGYHVGAHPMDRPDRANWRREDVSRHSEQASEDQDTWAKKPRKFVQEQRRVEQNKRGTHVKENNTSGEQQRSDDAKAKKQPPEIRERTQRNRAGPDFQLDDHQRGDTETKRRQGPIKPPKPASQEELGSEGGAAGRDTSDRSRSSQNPTSRAGGGSGRHAPLQARGGRRTHPQNHRPDPRKWDKMPQSKETQTG